MTNVIAGETSSILGRGLVRRLGSVMLRGNAIKSGRTQPEAVEEKCRVSGLGDTRQHLEDAGT